MKDVDELFKEITTVGGLISAKEVELDILRKEMEILVDQYERLNFIYAQNPTPEEGKVVRVRED